MGRFMQYYRETAKWKERTYAYVERVGMAKLKSIVVDDSEGIGARLDQAMQELIDAYVDPWLERDAPATSHQFTSLVPVEG